MSERYNYKTLNIMEGEREPLLELKIGENHKENHCLVDMSPVIFAVGEGEKKERIMTKRKSVKATKSPLLNAILTDAYQNGNAEIIEIPDVHPEHFKNFLKYVEHENFSLESATFTVEEVIEVYKIAKIYSVTVLPQECRQYLERVRSVGNAIIIYQCAQQLDEPQLEHDTYNFIIKHFVDVLQSKDFTNLTFSNLYHFLKLDEIVVSEVVLFQGVCRWAEAECDRQGMEKNPSNKRAVLQNALFLVRFPLLSPNDISMHIIPQEMLTPEEIDAINHVIMADHDKKRDMGAVFNCKRRGIIPPKTYSVCFFEGVVYNSDSWNGEWKYNLIKVNRPVAIVSLGFDGPIKVDATYHASIRLTMHDEENVENRQPLPTKDDIVHAKKERSFFVKFDNPVILKPDVWYRACYSLSGPAKTKWGVQPKSQVQMFCDDAGNVVFSYHCVDGQMPEIKFTIPS